MLNGRTLLRAPELDVLEVLRLLGRHAALLARRRAHRLGDRRLRVLDGLALAERAPVLVREHLDELRASVGPVIEDLTRAQRAGPAVMVLDQSAQLRLVGEAVVPAR